MMYMMDLNMTSFQEAKKTINTVLIPIGMIEAHGPHCSLGTDVLIPREFTKRLNEKLGDQIIIAPEIPYGHSWALAPFDGIIEISAKTFATYVSEVCQGFVDQGFKNIILFNGHGGNVAALKLVSEQTSDLGVAVLSINWWEDYRTTIAKYAPSTGHAGEDETSVILAIDESLADMEREGLEEHIISTPSNLKLKNMGKLTYPKAYSGHPAAATAQKGEQILEAVLPLIIKDIQIMWQYNQSN